MKMTEFWSRMEAHFGQSYARSWARDTHIAALGGRTPEQALAHGEDVVTVWRAVWAHEGMPARDR